MVIGSNINGITNHCSKLDIVSADLETHRALTQLWLQDVRSFNITIYTESKETTLLTEQTITIGENTKARVPKGGSISIYSIGNYTDDTPGPETGGRRVVGFHAGQNIEIGGLLSGGQEIYTIHNSGTVTNADLKSIKFNNTVNKSSSLPWTLGDTHPGITVQAMVTKVARVAAQSVTQNSVSTFLSFDTEYLDEASAWTSGSPTRITVPSSGGYKNIRIFGSIRFEISATGSRNVSIRKNGTAGTEIGGQGAPAFPGTTIQTYVTFDTGLAPVTGGDYFEVLVNHSSGAALDVFGNVTAELT
jgi:hypothetical protein